MTNPVPGVLAQDEPNLGTCDYYLGIGKCSVGGCWEEPACFTDQPRNGWPEVVRHPYAEFLITARRYDYRTSEWVSWERVKRFLRAPESDEQEVHRG